MKLTILSLFKYSLYIKYSFQVSIIKIPDFNHITIDLYRTCPKFVHITSFSYRISLIKCLIERSFKICNNWTSFYNDIKSIKCNLIKNAYPPFLIHKFINRYLNYKFSTNQNQLKDTFEFHCFKLPYIGNLWHHIKNKLVFLVMKLAFFLCKKCPYLELFWSIFSCICTE